jgi:hypothetical protein
LREDATRNAQREAGEKDEFPDLHARRVDDLTPERQ